MHKGNEPMIGNANRAVNLDLSVFIADKLFTPVTGNIGNNLNGSLSDSF